MSTVDEVKIEREKNPCKTCIHYEWCKGHELCNTYVSKEQDYNERRAASKSESDYAEYRSAYITYINDDQ